jgi:hypothetical protein
VVGAVGRWPLAKGQQPMVSHVRARAHTPSPLTPITAHDARTTR